MDLLDRISQFLKDSEPFASKSGHGPLVPDWKAEETTPRAADVFLHGPIGGWYQDALTAKSVREELEDQDGDILVSVSSPGGSVFEGLAIYHVLMSYEKGSLDVVADGIVASAGMMLFSAGRKRYMRPKGSPSRLMIHSAWGWTMFAGNEAEFVKWAKKYHASLRNANAIQEEILEANSDLDMDEIQEMTQSEEDHWLGRKDAQEKGFATGEMAYPSDDDDEDEDMDARVGHAAMAADLMTTQLSMIRHRII